MGLRSRCFRGDAKLEAAEASHTAHIVLGARGDHVAKLQHALLVLGEVGIDVSEQEGKHYGQSTAKAVLDYKSKRNIINHNYQSQADNITGIMTMAALDKEMQEHEAREGQIVTISCNANTSQQGSTS